MSKELVCPFCNKKLEPIGTSGQFQCGTWGCDASFNFIATRDVWEYIDRTRKELEQSEICCTEWEKQALDYKAENIALSGDLERTRKALDVAVDVLKEINELLSSNKFDVKEVPLLSITQTKISMLLRCINIEQKESAFVHNKIEFPEYNDGLLEEFDKQFFENGQDEDLTETALEQKDTK